MAMLREIQKVWRPEGEPKRRWFQDAFFDLIVWLNDDDTYIGFQLCYEVRADERVLTWHEDRGYAHNRVDSGEEYPTRNMSPILVADGVFDRDKIADIFKQQCDQMDQSVANFVLKKLYAYELKSKKEEKEHGH